MGEIQLQVITNEDLVEVNYDIDGSVLNTMYQVDVTEGVIAQYFTHPDEIKPSEINLRIGGVDCECVYSEELDDAISRIDTIGAVELFEIIGRNLIVYG